MAAILDLIRDLLSFVLFFATTIAVPYFVFQKKMGFLIFAAFPLGTLIPCIVSFVVFLGMMQIVPNRDGMMMIPMFLGLGATIVFLIASWLGAFFWVESATFMSRFWIGVKLASPFAALATVFVGFLMFWEG